MASAPSDKKKINIKPALGYLGWIIIYTAIVLGTGFYLGAKNQAKAQADTKAAVEQAVKAVTPAPASVPKS